MKKLTIYDWRNDTNGTVAVRITFTVMMALVLCGGCRGKTDNSSANGSAQPSGTPARLDLSNMSEDKLLPYVGQRVTVIGFWYSRTKSGSCVCATAAGGDPRVNMVTRNVNGILRVNQLNRRSSESVEVTGTLRYRPPPANTPPADPSVPVVQPSDVRFYFEMENADITFVDHTKEAASQP